MQAKIIWFHRSFMGAPVTDCVVVVVVCDVADDSSHVKSIHCLRKMLLLPKQSQIFLFRNCRRVVESLKGGLLRHYTFSTVPLPLMFSLSLVKMEKAREHQN